MNEILKMKCDLIEKNYLACRQAAKLTMSQAVSLAALLYTAQNKLATEQEIRNNRELLKSKTGMFSNLRGLTNIALLAKMSNYEDPGKYIDQVIDAYDAIKGKIVRSEYMTLAAQAIVETVDPSKYNEMAEKTKEVWSRMQANHLLLTGYSDFGIAAMLAVSGADIDRQINEAETCFQLLKKTGFTFNKDALQTICHVMALSDKSVEEKTIKFASLRDDLKSAGHPIRWEHLPIISTFCATDIPNETIIQEICDADDYLKHKKGFGALSCGRQLRRLYACALVLQTHEIEMQESASKKARQLAHTTVQQIINEIINVIIVSSVVAASNASRSANSN